MNWLWIAAGILAVANIGGLIFAFLRFRATRDLPPTLPQAVKAPIDDDGVTPAALLSDLQREFQSLQRAFNDLHSTVETRHRSLTGFISKKMGARSMPAEPDDDDEGAAPVRVPKSAYEKLAELEAQHAPPPPPQNSTRRHLRRF